MQDTLVESIRKNGVVLVFKKSQYQIYVVERENLAYSQKVEREDPLVSAMMDAHRIHTEALASIQRDLKRYDIRAEIVYRADLTEELTDGKLVISLGGDGTALDASHSIRNGWLLGVNSDPKHSVGFLCACNAETFHSLMGEILQEKILPTKICRVETFVNGKSVGCPALNEVLFCDQNPAGTSRYIMHDNIGAFSEEQKSSGIWVSSAMGCTGAIHSAGFNLPVSVGAEFLIYRVREPYFGGGPTFKMVQGTSYSLKLTSKMRSGGLYIDGTHMMVNVEFGQRVNFQSGAPLNMIITKAMEARREKANG